MMTDDWLTAALTNDAMVVELLIRMKQPSSLDSSSPTTTSTALLPPIRWGHHKSRSKPFPITTTNAAAAAAASGFGKEQQSGSPTTPLYWRGGDGGGGGVSTSDGYEESSRPSDLSSGGRSIKGGLGNEGATTSTYKKSRKRKSFAELKEEEDFLMKERLHLNRELESMRVTMNKQIVTSQNLRKLKIEKTSEMLDNEPQPRAQKPYVVEPEIEGHENGFVLPDLNMTPDVEELLL
ncbi:uncharacterized protein LOC112527793 isoform X1 [Cynara cardunculus var. scolymus]|uniref:Uncharacterized protein n=1 Tax=Cynara cardunculus var. scolymus TaxID=59895 RepID=A0A103XT98_CYNCS|nr:uncharacterized protein LOC112527793 isoform X1 [Cynara cardunculus var. scolymus]KVH96498.1 hypothetical protein Ccrd_001418 [Cynara cardunculus var. scolymus]